MDRCEFALSMADYEKRIKEAASEAGEKYVRKHHKATFYDHVEATAYLLSHGADKTTQNNLGETPLTQLQSHLALFKKAPDFYQTKIIALLKDTP